MAWRVKAALIGADAALLAAVAYGMRGVFDIRMGGLGGWQIGVPKAVAVAAVWALVAAPVTGAAMRIEWLLRRRRLSHQL